jgi:hypothetical protein
MVRTELAMGTIGPFANPAKLWACISAMPY